MKMISYWKEHQQIYVDEGFVLITGWYDHKNQSQGGVRALGVHWGSYPQSRAVLSPCVIPEATRSAILSGLLHKAVSDGDLGHVNSITEAIGFFRSPPAVG